MTPSRSRKMALFCRLRPNREQVVEKWLCHSEEPHLNSATRNLLLARR
jgi:hypothetical protein